MRWAIAGYGWVARDYMAPAIIASGGTVSAIADPSPVADAAVNGAALFADLESLIANARLDALYIATPNHLHRPLVEMAAVAGLPILCEKPMAATLADAEAMAYAVDRAGVLFGSAFDQRHHPAHPVMRDAVARGDIGKITAIRIVYACWVGPDWCSGNWRAEAKAAGGGAGIDLALHGLDLVQFLLGEEITGLQAMLQRRVHDYGVEDGAMFTGQTASGILVSLHVAYNCPEALPRRRLEIVGSTGSLEATDTMGQTPGGQVVRRCGASGDAGDIPFDTTLSPFTAQAAAFAEAVNGRPHDFDIARDLRLMRLFDAAYRKAAPCH